jgi:uncharacterized DUF497 family protein
VTKAAENRRRHGVSFGEALTVFRNPLARIFDDPEHSTEEFREIIIGHSGRNRLPVVSFTERADELRIISARCATKRERESYEEGSQETQER